ncbi:Cytochrome c, mono-and diheme variant [Alloalcanivorax dieselolei B5]|uniref:Cytochrome c, mono-and diheme variant n=1 Tax=Alcanivorax dieselolei (strain DSM 16502 / CGMCC 1.3690 / MCCC 1A00001 / B-5) TaxID=930169 RepID=K0C7D1_ALCDB|nr:cytochrome c, mono-and diheme variant [Alloalcanivorax dieselolei]AFT68448.1 Cytochrome c, mono-and diheme variant [Alloalcanivorax dieselolei B5]GGJ99591.1 cytochrome c-552 [Alloalcanivorax dieselolei]
MRIIFTMLMALGGLIIPPAQADPRNDFLLHCSGCHRPDGAGTEVGGIPDFRGYVSSFLMTPEGRHYILQVPGVIGSGLSDRRLTEVMNYVLTTWGQPEHIEASGLLSEQEVRTLRADVLEDVVGYRREVVKALRERGLPVATYPWP